MWLLPEINDRRNWIAARHAASLLESLYGCPSEAWREIVAHAAADLVATRCGKYRAVDEEGDIRDRVETLVSGEFWRIHQASDSPTADWRSGRFAIVLRAEDGIGWREIALFGVEFCEEDLRKVFSLPPPSFAVFPEGALLATSSQAPPARIAHRRGPKPKAFWGEAMAAVDAKISAGELLASTQADIERAMMNWIVDEGYDAGESTVRNYAKPIWERMKAQGQ